MKHVKKLASLLLMLVMIISLATPAFAATVTLPSDTILTGHTFTAYQVFSGREEGGVLSDIQWGTGIDSEAFLAALKGIEESPFAGCATATDVAAVLTGKDFDSAIANQVAKLAEDNKFGGGTALTAGTQTLADGYYLIVDTTADVGDGGAYNAALLQVVGDIDITVKTDAPSVEKKVLEDDKDTPDDAAYGSGYNDVADYDMGEAVPFHLIGLVPDMSRYDTYKYIFHDTLSSGLTPPENTAVKVYLSTDKAVGDDTDITSSFNVSIDEQKITVSSNNIKDITGIAQGKYIIVEYSAVLNHNAEVGLPGNPNVVYLEYSNKPDQSGAGDTGNTGNTPEDKVIVFTYELDVTKVDGKNTETKLQDAKFVLLNSDRTKVAKITSGKFDGWEDVPSADAEGNITWDDAYILTSAETTGLFSVTGLDDGTYYLKEIVAPAGYNLLADDVNVIITATTANGQDWTDGIASKALTALSVTADGVAGTGDTDTGIAALTIANNAGSTLPETGGIGTTIFYVLGSILFVGAIVLLVTKKRMRHGDK